MANTLIETIRTQLREQRDALKEAAEALGMLKASGEDVSLLEQQATLAKAKLDKAIEAFGA